MSGSGTPEKRRELKWHSQEQQENYFKTDGNALLYQKSQKVGKKGRIRARAAETTETLSHVHATVEGLATVEMMPPHPPREETPEYAKTHHHLVYVLDSPCAMCGVRQSTLNDPKENPFGAVAIEIHHYPIDRSLLDACDPLKIGVVFPQVKDRSSLEAFIDSEQNLMVLCDIHHRHPLHGIHHLTPNDFFVQLFLLEGYQVVATKDVETAAMAADEQLIEKEEKLSNGTSSESASSQQSGWDAPAQQGSGQDWGQLASPAEIPGPWEQSRQQGSSPVSPPLPPPPPSPGLAAGADPYANLPVPTPSSAGSNWYAASYAPPSSMPVRRAAPEHQVAPPQQPRPRNLAQEQLQFTAFYPRTAPVETWNTLIVYSYIESALQAVRADAYRFKDQLGPDPFKAEAWASRPLTRGVQITVVPVFQGVTFNPERISFTWTKDWHPAIFSFNADRR